MFSNNPFNKHRADNEVLSESKFLIPEEIPANERTAFHGAAAGAAKDGKTSFSFAGKKYPVTMKKDTASAIADQKEATHYTDYFVGHKHAKKAGMGVKVHSKGADGDNVTISHADPKKLQKYVDNHLGGGKIKEVTARSSGYGIRNKVSDMPGVDYSWRDKYKSVASKDAVKRANAQSDKKRAEYRKKMGMKEDAGIPHKYTVDLYSKDHGSHSSFIKKAQSAGIKGVYSGVNSDGKVKVSLNHHDNSDGGTIHKFLKKHYDKDMTHGNMQTMKTGSSSQKESVGKTAGDKSYFHLQKAKELAKKDGHDYDKLPQYDRTHNKHKDHYHDMAKKESVKKESTMTFREKLMSLYEGDRAAHYKSATKPEEYDEKQKSSKGAMDMMKTPKSVEADGMKAAKDTADAIKKSAPGKKMRKGDQNKGDLSIKPSATPVKDPSAKIITAEEYGMFGKKISNNLLDAVAMVEDMNKVHTVDIDHMTGTAGSHEKKHGITLKKSKNYGKGPGSNMATDATGTKANLQKYLKKHYDGDHKTMHPEIYK